MSRTERIESLIRDVLDPLLEKDGGGLELARVEEGVITLRITGALLGCPGTSTVKRGVIEPALRTIVGPDTEIVYERPSFL